MRNPYDLLEDSDGAPYPDAIQEAVMELRSELSAEWVDDHRPELARAFDRLLKAQEQDRRDQANRLAIAEAEGLLSNVTRGGQRLTWRELAEDRAEVADRLAAWGQICADLDRCEHGRHEDDDCFACHGRSRGNPFLPGGGQGPSTSYGHRIGTTINGRPIVIPERARKHLPEAWRPS